MHQKKFKSVIRDGYELYLVVEIPYDQQQNYLASESEESKNIEEEALQNTDGQQLGLPF